MHDQQTHLDGADRDVVLLPELPALGPLYARAAGGSALGAGTRTARGLWAKAAGAIPGLGSGSASSGGTRLELPAVDLLVADVPVDDDDLGELVAEIPQRVAEGVARRLPHCQSGLLAERRSAR